MPCARIIGYCFTFLLTLSLLGCGKSPAPQRLAAWTHTDNGAYGADLSSFGEYAVVSTAQGITMWQVQQHKPQFFWQHSERQVNQVVHVDIADDNSFAVTASGREIALWNMETGYNKGFWSVDESQIMDIKVANQGNSLLIGLLNGVVEYYNLTTGRRLRFLGHSERISAIDLSANGRYALTGSYDGKTLLWSTKTAQVIHSQDHKSRVTSLVFDQSGQLAFSAGSMNESLIWHIPSGELKSQLQYPMRQLIFSSVKFSHNRRFLVTGAPTQVIKLWDVETGKLIAEWPYEADRFTSSILDFAFSEDDKQLTAENSDGKVEIWDITRYHYIKP